MLAISCFILLIMEALFIRSINKKKPSDIAERRRRPELRRLLNTFLLMALGAFIVLICGQLWLVIRVGNIAPHPQFATFSPYFYTAGGFVVAYASLILGVVRLVRFINKDKSSDETTQQSPPTPRRLLNTFLLVTLGAAIALICGKLWLVIGFDNITSSRYPVTFSPDFYIAGGFVITYTLLLIGGVRFIRFINKNKPSGDGERRRHPALRLTLNVLLMTALGAFMALIGWQLWLVIRNLQSVVFL